MNGQEFELHEELGELGELSENEELAEVEQAEELGEMGENEEVAEQFLGGLLGSLLNNETGLSEAQEAQLAAELLEVSSEQELEQFLGGLFKRVIKGVGSFMRSPTGRSLGAVLKNLAKKALPVIGGALGSMVAPGVGTALGSKLGSMASGLFEVNEALSSEQAEQEVARRFVQLATAAARQAAAARPAAALNPRTVARAAVARAARTYAPRVYRTMLRSLMAGRGRRVGAVPGVAAIAAPVAPGTFAPAPLPGARLPRRPVRVGGVVDGGWDTWTDPGDDTAFEPIASPVGVGPAGSGRWVRRGRKIVVLGV